MLLLAALLACTSNTSDDTSVPDADTDADADTDTDTDTDADTDTDVQAPTWSRVVYPIVEESCQDCHARWGESADDIYTTWTTESDAGLPLVTAGDPSQSYIYLKITAPPRGEPMPLQLTDVRAADIAALQAWIEAGAANDATFESSMVRIYDNYACDDCHSDWANHGDWEALYATVTTRTEDGYPFIDPGNPSNSYIYLKISSDTPPSGGRMPSQIPPLEAGEIADIAAWITAGALQD